MPSGASFPVIAEYNLTKHREVDHEVTTCKDMVSLDQEVPQARSYLEEGDFYNHEIKSEIMEPSNTDFFCFMNMYDNNNVTNGTVITSNSIITNNSSIESRIPPLTSVNQTEFPSFFSTPIDSLSPMSSTMSLPTDLQHSMISSTSSLSSSLPSTSSPMLSSTVFSSSSSPMLSSHIDIPSSNVSNRVSSPVKMSSFVSSLGGSGGGCVVLSSAPAQTTDFLSGEVFTLPNSSTPNFLSHSSPPMVMTSNTSPSLGVPEDNLDYIDLDKQPTSFYDDFKPMKQDIDTPMDSSHLEQAALMMRDVIHHDCDSLKVPYDPILWNVGHVRRWVSWVCQKNGLPDVSSMAAAMDGTTLCSLKGSDFRAHYGPAGESLSTELELWKAANSCFPDTDFTTSIQSPRPTSMPISVPQISSLLDSEPNPHHLPYSVKTKHGVSTPCVSPAPSSTSQDSSNHGSSLAMEGSSDNSDDEYSSSDNLSFTGSNKVGRGHKQTIHLWQFLRELLLSKDNHTDCIRWLDRKAGIFKIEDSKKVAYLWGQRKNRPAMNYDKLSRSVRQYYKKKIIKKTETTKRLVYQFCPGYL